MLVNVDIYTYRSVPPTREILNVISDIPPTGIRSLPVVNSRRRFCNSLGNDNTTSQKFLQNHIQCTVLSRTDQVESSLKSSLFGDVGNCHYAVIILKAVPVHQSRCLWAFTRIPLHSCVKQMFVSAHSGKKAFDGQFCQRNFSQE